MNSVKFYILLVSVPVLSQVVTDDLFMSFGFSLEECADNFTFYSEVGGETIVLAPSSATATDPLRCTAEDGVILLPESTGNTDSFLTNWPLVSNTFNFSSNNGFHTELLTTFKRQSSLDIWDFILGESFYHYGSFFTTPEDTNLGLTGNDVSFSTFFEQQTLNDTEITYMAFGVREALGTPVGYLCFNENCTDFDGTGEVSTLVFNFDRLGIFYFSPFLGFSLKRLTVYERGLSPDEIKLNFEGAGETFSPTSSPVDEIPTSSPVGFPNSTSAPIGFPTPLPTACPEDGEVEDLLLLVTFLLILVTLLLLTVVFLFWKQSKGKKKKDNDCDVKVKTITMVNGDF